MADLTVRTAVVAGLAVAALLLTGWRKPARAEPRSPRGRSARPVPVAAPARGVAVEHRPTQLYRPPGLVRRLLAAAASGGIAVLTGVVTAILIAFGAALSVMWMTNLLDR